MNFDPFSDRLARDIRNSLSTALVAELTGAGDGHLSTAVDGWAGKAAAATYAVYIKERSALYRRAIDIIKAGRIADPRYQAIRLWNLGLFFEMHELLETVWQHTRGPERTALKGWIQAAGVYVHVERGKMAAARRLARRAEMHLRYGREALGFITNLDEVIAAVAVQKTPAPQLVPDQ